VTVSSADRSRIGDCEESAKNAFEECQGSHNWKDRDEKRVVGSLKTRVRLGEKRWKKRKGI